MYIASCTFVHHTSNFFHLLHGYAFTFTFSLKVKPRDKEIKVMMHKQEVEFPKPRAIIVANHHTLKFIMFDKNVQEVNFHSAQPDFNFKFENLIKKRGTKIRKNENTVCWYPLGRYKIKD